MTLRASLLLCLVLTPIVPMLTSFQSVTFQIDRNPAIIAAAVKDILKSDAKALAAFSGQPRPRVTQTGPNRRRDERRSIKVPVSLSAVVSLGNRAQSISDSTALGLAVDLSDRGIGLVYDSPLKSRFVVIEFDIYGVGPLQMLTELRWAKKRNDHDFIAGGLFTGVATEAH